MEFIKTITILTAKHGVEYGESIKKGVSQIARLWKKSDGDEAAFESFCLQHFIASPQERAQLFNKISRNLEILWGSFNKIKRELGDPLYLNAGDVKPIDQLFGGYDISGHMEEN